MLAVAESGEGNVVLAAESQYPTFSTKAEVVYTAVRERILQCRILPGSFINQVQLAEELRVSTTPLREALRRLNSEGLVELGAHRDARVTPLSASEALQLYEVRLRLDPLAAELAARRITSAMAEHLKNVLSGLEPIVEGVPEEALSRHRELHDSIYLATENTILVEMLHGLWDKTERYRRFGLEALEGSGTTRHKDFEEHFELVNCIIDGDAELASSLMREHVESSLARLALDQLSSDQSGGN